MRCHALLTLALLALCACEEKKAATSTTPPAPTPVVAVKAITQDVPDRRTYPGVTQSPATVNVDARVRGYLQERSFEEGDDVSKGDRLYLIQPEQYQADVERAEAETAVARTNLAHANHEKDRNEPLAADGAISQQEWDRYVKAADDAASRLAAAEADLTDAKLKLSYTIVTAPIDGRVGATMVDVGNLVGPGSSETLAQIVQLDPMRVVFSPSTSEYTAFERARRAGAVPVTVSVQQRGAAPLTFDGAIDLLDNTAQARSSTFTARAQFDSTDKLVLPAQLVNVQVHLGTISGAILVPSSALIAEHTDHYVYVVKSDQTIESRQVQLGDEFGAMTHIISGLKEGETVVASASPKIRAGDKVTVTLKPANEVVKQAGSSGDSAP